MSHDEGATVFQTFEWHEAWWTVFGEPHDLRLVLVYAPGDTPRLVAIAPLMVIRDRRWGVPVRRLMLIGTPNASSDYADFVVHREAPAARRAIVEWIRAQADLWTELQLGNLREESSTVAALASIPDAWTAVASEAPAWIFGDPAADQGILAKKSLRRHTNGFTRRGRLEFHRLANDYRALEPELEPFFDQHVRRWAGTATPSLFTHPDQRRFYRLVAAALAPAGLLHFSVVRFDDEPIAFHFGFECRSVLTWYKPAYEPNYAKQSPGEVLIKFLFEDAIARGLSELDFTIGYEAFKYRFANRIRKVCRVRAYRRLPERVAIAQIDLLKAGVRRLRRAVPAAESWRRAPST